MRSPSPDKPNSVFLLALNLSILKFEKQNELIILWTSGVKKIYLVNLFLQ